MPVFCFKYLAITNDNKLYFVLVSGIESSARGLDSTVSLVSGGNQEWILIPTTIRSEQKMISCKPLQSKECKLKKKLKEYRNMTQWDLNKVWFDHITPQLVDSSWNGR